MKVLKFSTMPLLLTIIFVLLLSNFFVYLGHKINLPSVVSLILTGLFLDIPSVREVIINGNEDFIANFGHISLLALMFLAGFESSWSTLKQEARDSTLLAVFGVFLPLLVALLVFPLLGFSLLNSAIIGVCMSITAEATRAQILLELGYLKTRLGSVMMGSGIVDDILGLGLFILSTALLGFFNPQQDLLLSGAILAFCTGALLEKEREEPARKLHHKLFAHLRSLLRPSPRQTKFIHRFERFLNIFIIPFFFVSIGLNFTLGDLTANPLLLSVLLVLAISSKIISALLLKPFTTFSLKQLYVLGWTMNSRGAVGMALALIAFQSGLVPSVVYSNLIVMALTTTLLFPLIAVPMIRKDPKLMN